MAGHMHRRPDRRGPAVTPEVFAGVFADTRGPVRARKDFDSQEEYDEWRDEYWFTPRTAYALAAVAEVILDDYREYTREIAPGEWVEDFEYSWTTVNPGTMTLPWLLRFRQAFKNLISDLALGDLPLPRCTAEEVALHTMIDAAEGYGEDIKGEMFDYGAIPPHPEDFDWEQCRSLLFEDHDVLMLNNPALDGIENDEQAIERMGLAYLRRSEWFQWFGSVEQRYDLGTFEPFDDFTDLPCDEDECATCEPMEHHAEIREWRENFPLDNFTEGTGYQDALRAMDDHVGYWPCDETQYMDISPEVLHGQVRLVADLFLHPHAAPACAEEKVYRDLAARVAREGEDVDAVYEFLRRGGAPE